MKKEKIFFGTNEEEFESRSYVHGLSYVFGREFKLADRVLSIAATNWEGGGKRQSLTIPDLN